MAWLCDLCTIRLQGLKFCSGIRNSNLLPTSHEIFNLRGSLWCHALQASFDGSKGYKDICCFLFSFSRGIWFSQVVHIPHGDIYSTTHTPLSLFQYSIFLGLSQELVSRTDIFVYFWNFHLLLSEWETGSCQWHSLVIRKITTMFHMFVFYVSSLPPVL